MKPTWLLASLIAAAMGAVSDIKLPPDIAKAKDLFDKAKERAAAEGKNAAAKARDASADFLKKVKSRADGLGKDAKNAGAIVSNGWKWTASGLNPTDGWIRSHCHPGDILLGGNPVNLDLGQWAHTAIVTDVGKELLFEATANVGTDKPGTHESRWSAFASQYLRICKLRVKGLTPDQTAKVVDWVKLHRNIPYRYPALDGFERNDDARMYCSQLVWIAYKRVANVDIQGRLKGPVIHPDDIYHSDKVERERIR